jgi:hypothetical protein
MKSKGDQDMERKNRPTDEELQEMIQEFGQESTMVFCAMNGWLHTRKADQEALRQIHGGPRDGDLEDQLLIAAWYLSKYRELVRVCAR